MQIQLLACHKGVQYAQLHMTQMIVLAQQSSRQSVVLGLKADNTTVFCLYALHAQLRNNSNLPGQPLEPHAAANNTCDTRVCHCHANILKWGTKSGLKHL